MKAHDLIQILEQDPDREVVIGFGSNFYAAIKEVESFDDRLLSTQAYDAGFAENTYYDSKNGGRDTRSKDEPIRAWRLG
jgi:hypothetical protein